MSSNVLLFGWNHPLPGRERLSAEHFENFVEYLTGLQKRGGIDAFDTVFLEPHGGDLNGFFLIRGDGASLDALTSSQEWSEHMVRSGMHLEGAGFIRGYTGDAIMPRMQLWTDSIPD